MRRILRSLALAFLLLAAPAAGQVVDVVFPGYRVFVAANDSTLSTHQTYHVALERAVNFAIATGRATRIELVGPVRVTVDPSQVPVPEPDPDEPDEPADTVPTPDPDPQPEPDPDPPPDVQPPPPSTGTAWYEQDWQSITGPGIENSTAGGGAVSLLTNAAGPGFDRAMRATFSGGAGNEPQVGLTLSFPRASQDRPREVWVELYMRWSPNWTTDGPGSGNPDHKTVFLFDQARTGSARWEFNVGSGGDMSGCFFAGEGQHTPLDKAAVWDGQWHRVRLHARFGTGDALWMGWIDGQPIPSGLTTINPGADRYFSLIALSRNLNRGTDRTMTLDFGPVRVYTTNPGWN